LQTDPFEYVLAFEQGSEKERKQLKKLLENPMIWNKYAYCFDNPIGNIDPDGEFSIGVIILGVLALTVSAIVVKKFLDKTYEKAIRSGELKGAVRDELGQMIDHNNGRGKYKKPEKLDNISQLDDIDQFANDMQSDIINGEVKSFMK
jgi:hypothetical protein